MCDSDVELELVAQSKDKLVLAQNIIRKPILDLSNIIQTDKMNANEINPAVVSKNEIQMLIQAIPEYSPGQNLNIFINEVDNLVKHLQNRLTNDLSYVLNFSIRTKIKGAARDFISHQNASEWPEIRKALLSKYGEQRSEDLLVSALSNCVQKSNESYMDYFSRLLKRYNTLMHNVTLNITDPQYLGFKQIEYGKLALRTFRLGTLEPYRSHLTHFDLKTVEECLEKCKEFDNTKRQWDYCEFIRRSQNPKKQNFSPSPMNQNTSFINQPNKPMQFHPQNLFFKAPLKPNQPMFKQNSGYQPNFKSNPGNNFQKHFQPNPNYAPPKLFTNKQVFGTKPGSAFVKNSSHPQPMSIQSKINTPPFMRQNKPGPSNFFRQNPNQKPNFIAEELFNVEPQTDYFYTEDSDYDYNYEDDEDDSYQYETDPEVVQNLEENTETQEADESNFQSPASQPPET